MQATKHGDGHDLSATARGGRRAERDALTDPLMTPSAIEIRERYPLDA
jgi:hypothetical protein